MSKRPGFSNPDASLRRQCSMTVEGSFNRNRPSRPCSPKVLMNPAVAWYNVGDPTTVTTSRDIWGSSATGEGNRTFDTRHVHDPSENNSKFLEVKEHFRSGRSSALRDCRSSQPTSFESYDSSASAISWASSGDPEPTQLNSQDVTQRGDIPIRGNIEDSASTGHLDHQSRVVGPVCAKQPEQETCAAESTTKVPVCTSTQQLSTNNTKKDCSNRKDAISSWKTKDKSGAKTAGFGCDQNEKEKSPQSLGGQNIKGLWKRAFQSLRKDKLFQGKREKRFPETMVSSSVSDEVDPVYHLLRCAASKSQATVALTTGMGSHKTATHHGANRMETQLSTTKPVPYNFMRPTRSVSLRNPRTDVN